MPDLEQYVTVRQACGVLGLSRVRVASFCRSGRLSGATRMGRMWVIPGRSLAVFARLERPPGRPRQPDHLGKSPL